MRLFANTGWLFSLLCFPNNDSSHGQLPGFTCIGCTCRVSLQQQCVTSISVGSRYAEPRMRTFAATGCSAAHPQSLQCRSSGGEKHQQLETAGHCSFEISRIFTRKRQKTVFQAIRREGGGQRSDFEVERGAGGMWNKAPLSGVQCPVVQQLLSQPSDRLLSAKLSRFVTVCDFFGEDCCIWGGRKWGLGEEVEERQSRGSTCCATKTKTGKNPQFKNIPTSHHHKPLIFLALQNNTPTGKFSRFWTPPTNRHWDLSVIHKTQKEGCMKMETLACSVNNNYSPTLHGVTYLTSVWCNGVSSDTPQIIFFVFSKLNPEMKC